MDFRTQEMAIRSANSRGMSMGGRRAAPLPDRHAQMQERLQNYQTHGQSPRGQGIGGPFGRGPPSFVRGPSRPEQHLQQYMQRYQEYAQQMGGQNNRPPFSGAATGTRGRAMSTPAESWSRRRNSEATARESSRQHGSRAAITGRESRASQSRPRGLLQLSQAPTYDARTDRAERGQSTRRTRHRDAREEHANIRERYQAQDAPSPGSRARASRASSLFSRHGNQRPRIEDLVQLSPRVSDRRMSMRAGNGGARCSGLGRRMPQAFGVFSRNREVPVPFDGLQRIKVLGEGSEGRAELVRSTRYGTLQVLKTVRRHRFQGPSNEVKALEALHQETRYKRIVYFARAQSAGGCTSILLEYCSGGDLQTQMQRFASLGSPVPSSFAMHVAVQLGEALAFLHHGIVRAEGQYSIRSRHEPIIHLDVKPPNILLRFPKNEDGFPEIVLADFGCAVPASRSRPGGTMGYIAPEVPVHVTTKADVYSYGVTVVSLIQGYGQPLWPCGADPSMLDIGGRYRGSGLRQLLQQCLQVDPRMRTKMSERSGLVALQSLRAVMRDRSRRGAVIPDYVWAEDAGR